MSRICVCSVAKVHTLRGDPEGHVEKDRVVPSGSEFVTMQEQAFDEDDSSIGCNEVCVAVPSLSVLSAPSRRQWVENMAFEGVLVVAVEPEPFR